MGCTHSKGAQHVHDDLERVYKAVEYLKTCQSFANKKAQDALAEIEMVTALEDDLKADLVKNLLSQGFAQLFLRIFQSLRAGKTNIRRSLTNESQRQENFKLITDICLDFTDYYIDEKTNISLELMQNGSINAILEELKVSCETKTQHRETIATMLMALDNCAACRADSLVRCTFRKADAVDILQKYLESEEMLFKTVSLFILSRITSEEEGNRLATTEGCISNLVQLTSEAIKSKDNEVFFDMFGEESIGYGLWRLIDAINRLATNTANQQKLVQHEVVAVIIELLQPYYMQDPEFMQKVMEILWKLAFVDSHKDIIISKLTESNTLQFVKNLQKSDNIGLCNASIGLLWKLGITDIHSNIKQTDERPNHGDESPTASEPATLEEHPHMSPSTIPDEGIMEDGQKESPQEENQKESPQEENQKESVPTPEGKDVHQTEVEPNEPPDPSTTDNSNENEHTPEDKPKDGETPPMPATEDVGQMEDGPNESPLSTTSNENGQEDDDKSKYEQPLPTPANEDVLQMENEPKESPPSTTSNENGPDSEENPKCEEPSALTNEQMEVKPTEPPPSTTSNEKDMKPEGNLSSPPTKEDDARVENLAGQIMISYQWDAQDRAVAVRDKLIANGCKVWMDIDEMRGNYLMAMADAVETSSVILICMSQKYKESVNCRQEAMYAYELKKPIIPLVMEDSYRADGWLGLLASGRIYYPVHCDQTLNSAMGGLRRSLKEHLKS